MVSFWPWKGDDSSPASFEKTLSTLSSKISNTQARLDRTRGTSRRVRVLWTLYLSFAYLIYTIVMLLVVGYPSFSSVDWAGVALGPVLIYVTRTVISSFFSFRADSISTQLKQQQAERAKTIQKLKDATRYDSTLQLLEKYGGEEGKPAKGKHNQGQDEEGRQGQDRQQRQNAPGRTTMPPPPTANIQRRDGLNPSAPGTPQPGNKRGHMAGPPPPPTGQGGPDLSAEFAPNAFAPPPPQYNQADRSEGASHWYDRVLDLLLGEDETASKNRIALICQNCRLVNGQAPPGTKSLVEVGIWKCMACGASNGEADEGKRIIEEVLQAQSDATDALAPGEEFKDEDDEEPEDVTVEALDVGQDEVGPGGRASGKHTAPAAKRRKGKSSS